MSESVTMMTNYPEAWERLKARRARHPREDAIEEFTEWTLLGQPVGQEAAKAQEPEVLMVEEKKEETHEEYIKRRTEHLMHKNIACRRGAGGKWFTIGGAGQGCAFQVR
tara:strand:- start:207 stop:533 length:327 start_codon:yes stop_codon:yes gene_type:complete